MTTYQTNEEYLATIPRDTIDLEFLRKMFRERLVSKAFEEFYNNTVYGEELLLENIKSWGFLGYGFPTEKLTLEMVDILAENGCLKGVPKHLISKEAYVKAAKNFRVRDPYMDTIDNSKYSSGLISLYNVGENMEFEDIEVIQAWLKNNVDLEFLIKQGKDKDARWLARTRVEKIPKKYIDMFVPEHLRQYYHTHYCDEVGVCYTPE